MKPQQLDLEFYVRTRACEKRESGKQPLVTKHSYKWSICSLPNVIETTNARTEVPAVPK